MTIWHMWDHRNSVLHDPAGQVLQQESNQINAQIRLQYMIGSWDLHPEDHKLLVTPIDVLCNKSIERKKLWLKSVASARENSLQFRISPTSPDPATNTCPDNTNTTGLTRWLQG